MRTEGWLVKYEAVTWKT